MRSTNPSQRRQSGQSLVEVMVASALLGLGVVTALTALDAAGIASKQALRQAWAACAVRAEAEWVLSAAWSTSAYAAPTGLSAVPGPGAYVQQVTVSAVDSDGRTVQQTVVTKVLLLSPSSSVSAAGVASGGPRP